MDTKDTTSKSSLYRDAGVDIDLAHGLLDRVKEKLAATRTPGVLAPIGGFGGLFQLDLSAYDNPVLVSSIDGVGTKLMVAAMAAHYAGVGFDIVNHCINDIAVQGAEPLYFMDYLGIGKLRSPLYEEVLGGIAAACAAHSVAVLGGETAEMPGMYGDDFDLVGCITGVVDKDRMITGEAIAPGHVMIGLPSNGLHTNGYSLARRVLFDQASYTVDSTVTGLGETIGEALLHPHVCYWPAIRRLITDGIPLHGAAHITGGGWFDNIVRVLPGNAAVACDPGKMPVPPIMKIIQDTGGIERNEMYRVFNMGMGMAVFVPSAAAEAALRICSLAGFPRAAVVGEVRHGKRTVSLNAEPKR